MQVQQTHRWQVTAEDITRDYSAFLGGFMRFGGDVQAWKGGGVFNVKP
ncbi:MAG TPA: hypothetical protein VFX43_09775 [Chitinophagaceae bacterium]|nr:hypothetical protein [Chitinophagaceae bacterium]